MASLDSVRFICAVELRTRHSRCEQIRRMRGSNIVLLQTPASLNCPSRHSRSRRLLQEQPENWLRISRDTSMGTAVTSILAWKSCAFWRRPHLASSKDDQFRLWRRPEFPEWVSVGVSQDSRKVAHLLIRERTIFRVAQEQENTRRLLEDLDRIHGSLER